MNGFISMAIPIKSYCFDSLRELSRVSDFIQAHSEKRVMPSNEQNFDHQSSYVNFEDVIGSRPWFRRSETIRKLNINKSLPSAYQLYVDRVNGCNLGYLDVQCWTFTPRNFKLIIEQLWLVGLFQSALQRSQTILVASL